MKIYRKHLINYLGLFFLCWFTVNSALKGVALENRAYLANGISIVEDYDLNIANNILENARWMVSKTLNLPDMHFDGIVNIYLPFYGVGKFIKAFHKELIQTPRALEDIYFLCTAIFSVFIFLFSLKILSVLFQKLTNLDKCALVLFILSTSVSYYTFFDFTSSDTACFFFSCLILYWTLKKDLKNNNDYLFHGMILGFAFILKPSFAFYLPLFSLKLFDSFKGQVNTNKAKYLGFFALGVSSLLTLKLINNYLRFNFLVLMSGYDYDFSFNKPDLLHHFKRVLFGPCGVFHQAPWIIISLIIAFSLLLNKTISKHKKILISVLLLSILGKYAYEVFCLSDSEFQFGYRRYTIDAPFCCYFIYEFLSSTEWKKKLLFYISTAAIFIYLIFYFFWFNYIDSLPGAPFGVYKMWETFPYHELSLESLKYFNRFNFFQFKEQAFYVALIVLIMYPLLNFLRDQKYYFKIAIILAVLYFPVTLTNAINNKRNAQKMAASNYFADKVIANNMSVFLYDEFLSEIGRNILIAKYNKDWYEYSKHKRSVLKYIESINQHIISDPIQFTKLNKEYKLRPNIFDSGINTETIMNYESKTFYNQAFD